MLHLRIFSPILWLVFALALVSFTVQKFFSLILVPFDYFYFSFHYSRRWVKKDFAVIKTTVGYHLTPVRMAIIKKSTNNCWRRCGEKRTSPPPHSVGGNVNWYSHYGEQNEGSLKN